MWSKLACFVTFNIALCDHDAVGEVKEGSDCNGHSEPPKDDSDLYRMVGNRRIQWDHLFWQVPVLSFTAQAFLFTIALDSASANISRFFASGLSIVISLLSIHLMSRHRQADVTDARWLEEYELKHFRHSFSGTTWIKEREAERRGGWPNRFKGYGIWITGMVLFLAVAIAIFVLTLTSPDVFRAH